MTRTPPSVVVVTGASAGVGRAVAHAFAREGARLGLIARSEEALQETCREVEALRGEALALPLDVADAAAVDDAAERAERAFGPIDVWVNAAMVTVYSPVSEMSAHEFRRVMEVTYLGYVHGTLAALARMRGRDAGTVVQVGSALAYRAIPLQSAYCAAKAAIRGFTDSLRSELIHERSRIRLTMVQLPAINTPQFDWARNRLPERPQPVPPIYQPEAAAAAIVRAAHEAPRELWVGRASITAILGNFVAPGLLDRALARQAYRGEQSDEPAIVGRPDNLDRTWEAPHRTHGRFDERARDHVLALGSGTVRGAVLAATAATAVGAMFGWRAASRRPKAASRR